MAEKSGNSSQQGSSAGTPEAAPVETALEAMESGDGWWGSWISAAKSKSVEVLGMVKKDLDELSTAVKSEASHVISSTSTAIGKTLKLDEPESTANTMRKSFSTFLDQVNTVLNPSPDDDDTEAILITDGDHVTLTVLQKELLALQRLDATYLVAPEGAALARMVAWMEASTWPSAAALERQLRGSPVLREKLEKLVPHAITSEDFWERYLFRRALLEDRLASSPATPSAPCTDPVLRGLSSPPSPARDSDSACSIYGSSEPRSLDLEVSEPSGTLDEEEDEDVAWDNEDFASNIQLSEEQQTQLLQEYEQEMKSAMQINNTLRSPAKTVKTPSKTKPLPSPAKGKKTTAKASPVKLPASKKIDTAKVDTSYSKTKKGARPPKTDIESKLVEDHFHDASADVKPSLAEELREKNFKSGIIADNASSNSDESWEKEFEIDDLRIEGV